MRVNLHLEWLIARGKRRDLLRQMEQQRLVRLTRAGCETSGRAGRRAQRVKVWRLWHRVRDLLEPNTV